MIRLARHDFATAASRLSYFVGTLVGLLSKDTPDGGRRQVG